MVRLYHLHHKRLNTVLKIVLIISLFCVGLHVSLEKGMILFPIRKLIQKLIYKKVKFNGLNKFNLEPTTISKPIMDCVYCMPSLYGSLIYFYYNFNNIQTTGFYVEWIITLFCSSALAGFIYEKL